MGMNPTYAEFYGPYYSKLQLVVIAIGPGPWTQQPASELALQRINRMNR
jgi:hypothetical protein